MRTKYSLRNISIGILSQIIIMVMGLISRKVFLDSLGANYLGINGLLTNVLSMLVLVEGGIAISIVYNLYKPLAENNKEQVIALIQLYKKAYAILALITLAISVGLYPFLNSLMKDSGHIPYLIMIYAIFVAKNIISYLNAHKWSLINADQRGYVLEKWNLIYQLITIITRIAILIITKDYVLYLVVELVIYAIQNILNGAIVNRRYPYIKTKIKHPLNDVIRQNIKKNVKAMFLHNIGGYLVFSTDNILISSFISVATVGLYSNYTMITQQLSALASPLLGGIGASVGNLIATEDGDKSYSIFKISYLVNFWVYALCIIFLFNLLEPFISWWLGRQYILGNIVFILILVNFYLNGMRTAISTFKNKAGLFTQDKYAPVIEGVINLVSSLILLHYLGLAGIFLGTTLSTISTVLWTQPYFVYKHLFKKQVRFYFVKYIFYAALTVAMCFLTKELCDFYVSRLGFLSLIERGLICLIVPNIIFVGIFFRTDEFQFVFNIIKSFLIGIKVKGTVKIKA